MRFSRGRARVEEIHDPAVQDWGSEHELGLERLLKSEILGAARNSLTYVCFIDDFRAKAMGNVATDNGSGSFADKTIYIVQSGSKAVQRCILMTIEGRITVKALFAIGYDLHARRMTPAGTNDGAGAFTHVRPVSRWTDRHALQGVDHELTRAVRSRLGAS